LTIASLALGEPAHFRHLRLATGLQYIAPRMENLRTVPRFEDLDERAALAAARNGDPAAFEWLVRRTQQRAYAVALGVLHHREDARDACQEAYLRAYRNLDRFDGKSRFSSWLHRIIVNVCIDRLRRVPPLNAVALDDVAPTLAGSDDPARTVEGAELGGRIGEALQQLSTAHRTALVLREVQGLSYLEIADAMRCSVGTVMSRLFHARRRLQALLCDDESALALAA
jgi:RNA polymerase sigma-70 factor, ECF subfamily